MRARVIVGLTVMALAVVVCGGPEMAPALPPLLTSPVAPAPGVAPALLASRVAATPPVNAGGPAMVDEETVHLVAAKLRCVVCQNLSVLDSPSEMAAQMRAIIRERLAAGETPDQVVQYFVDKYGEWILLSPRGRGFNLLVWAAPIVSVLVGLVVVAFLLRQWTRPREAPAAASIDPALRERVRRELESRP